MKTLYVSLAVVLAAVPVEAGGPKITKESVISGGRDRTYYQFVPATVTSATPAPLVVLLHGSGRRGSLLIEHWKRLAEKESMVLAGPDSLDQQMWTYPGDGPEFLRDVVEAVRATVPIDARRVYVFGHSAGASFGLAMSMLESTYFAAAAVHAGRLEDGSLASAAARAIPVSIQVGTEDRFFPLLGVRATRDVLAHRGLPVELTEIPRHGHNYYAVSDEINKHAWAFLKQHALERDPAYVEYVIRRTGQRRRTWAAARRSR